MRIKVDFTYTKSEFRAFLLTMTLLIGLIALGFGLTATRGSIATPSKSAYDRAVSLLEVSPLVDGHNDFPMALRTLFGNNITNFNFNQNLSSTAEFGSYTADHTDLPRLRAGHVGGQFWSAFIGCSAQYKDAVQLFMEQIDIIKRFIADYPEDMIFVTELSGLLSAVEKNKIAGMIGVESGHAIGSSLAILRTLYELGARYMTLTHSCNTPWADQSGVEEERPESQAAAGLSDFGHLVVKEMNRLGMLVDLSHVSEETMLDALETARAPIIFSHSGARAVYDHPRNVPDAVLQKVKINGGIVMVNFFSCYLIPDCGEDNRGTLGDVTAHINHIRDVAGVDHVGLGSDFNGISLTPEGLEDVSKFPNLFASLLEQHWSEQDLSKLASGNIIRVWSRVEAVRDQLIHEEPYQQWIPASDLRNDTTKCMSEI